MTQFNHKNSSPLSALKVGLAIAGSWLALDGASDDRVDGRIGDLSIEQFEPTMRGLIEDNGHWWEIE